MEPLGRWHGIGSTEVSPSFVARDRTTMSIRMRDAAETIQVGIHDGSKLERRDASTRRNLVVAGLFVEGVLYTVPQSHRKDPRYYPLMRFVPEGHLACPALHVVKLRSVDERYVRTRDGSSSSSS